MKLRLFSVFVVFLLLTLTQVYGQDRYALVEIEISRANMEQVQNLGLALDCCYSVPSADGERVLVQVPVRGVEIELLRAAGIEYRMLIEDLTAFYEQRALVEDQARAEVVRQSYNTRMNYGSMGGFYTLEEIISTMDNLYNTHKGKNIIVQKWVIGKSYEGRPIYAIKISDNADQEEGEAQVLYTALMHAREPAGMMTVFYFMHYLLENYPTNQRVKNIVDNCELYFVPCINPDGYGYNQKNAPNGGGMWRKNRNGSGTDLNRNWGPYELWNHPNGGSSTSPSSETYRGTAPFSEPETQTVRDLVQSKTIRTALNYHTYSNLLIYPWGYTNEVAHPHFQTMAIEMTRVNGYRHGTAPALLYRVRGDSDSWFYKELKVFSMTPEVGGRGDGFWPSKSRIFPLAQENLEANLLLAEYAMKMVK